jgi:hypothetical protein
VNAQQDARLAEMHDGWQKAARADEELGGEGDEGRGRYERSVAEARGFLRELGTPALGQVLTAFGLEHNPEMIRIFARAGRALHAARHLR